ncbi:VOC family protein [Streptomyces sp. BHT-5-2]|uniref:VOC family protein n=1 Tax=Streptomyces sp. BHT-5-2 TaxID=2866715 RepID=UPI0021B1511B|nr:VOC family protein [Streptomyces sp. BHT-5-2]
MLSADVIADVERLRASGAGVEVSPTSVGDVTVLARLRAPKGNAFALFSQSNAPRFEQRMDATHRQMEQVTCQPQPGTFGWFEMGTTDPRTTRDFYARAFGWQFEGEGPCQSVLTVGPKGPRPAGGLYDHTGRMDGADYAMPCFLADDVASLVEQAGTAGAHVEQGPEARPGGPRLRRLRDPHGNRFGLFNDGNGNSNGDSNTHGNHEEDPR